VLVAIQRIAIKVIAHSASTLEAMRTQGVGEEVMKRRILVSSIGGATIFLIVATAFIDRSSANDTGVVEAMTRKVTEGVLQAIGHDGQPRAECPLKHTDVEAEVSGQLARVTVTQEFHNPFQEEIEAVYVFPLSQSAAVDDMTMIIGDRTIKGKIKRREEAQAIYEAARDAGQTASLLDQERPNIFTQSVANIAPGAEVKITISYVEFLKYEGGTYEFVFPMVVGPRYIPGRPIGKQEGGWAADTSKVPDASRITPAIAPKDMREGHDISIKVKLDAGVPIGWLNSTLHEIDVARPDNHRAIVQLKDLATIPNKDFILKFDVAGEKISDAIMTHRGAHGGFFTLILQPPERVTAADVAPKELVFVLDTSGSMEGFPIEKAKETIKLALDNLYPGDTFNLITFSGDTHVLFSQPVPATRENLLLAQRFLASRQGSGGTEMMSAIRAALATSDEQDHVRIVCFMTDGHVANDMEIISEVRKHPNARVFAFGIGSSVNRFLLDKMAEHGRGEVEYVTLEDDGSAAARRFHERVRNPLLTDIEIDWAGLPVAYVYPKRLPDLFSAKPLILTGRYTSAARGVIRLSGRQAGQKFIREIPIKLPRSQTEHGALATLWARMRIDDLMGQDYAGIQRGQPHPDVREAITRLGLAYRLMTQFTSFVAVEEMIVSDGGRTRRVDVPVEMPQGMSFKGLFGANETARIAAQSGGASVAIDFSVMGVWRQIDWVTRVVMLILLIMSIWSIAVLIERHLGFIAARNQSREFAPKLAAFLKNQKIDEAISLSDKYKKSHLAMVVKAGLQGFRDHQLSSDISSEVIDASKRALQSATAIKAAEFRGGLSGLAAIGSTAPFVGLFGTVFGIIDTLVEMGSASSSGISGVAGGLAEALCTAAVGLAVAVPAVWFFNYLTIKVDNFSVEMENTSAELIDFFLKQRGENQYRSRY
jgi:Ca-activated chloride channel homolog